MQFNKDKLDLRLYQQTILNSAINQNTLVVLPTGLGKTHIAIALSAARLKENSKILVLAPTKPLILQHMQTFSEFFEPADKLALLTGEVSPNERKILWNDSKIIFSTPQTKINDVCKNLFIDKIEYRSRDDSEVKDYVKEIEIHYKSVELPDEIIAIKSRLERALQFRIDKLHRYGFLTNKSAIITKKALLHLQLTLRNQYRKKNFAVARGISVCASVIKLKHMLGLAESESLTALNEYFENLLEISKTTKTKAVKELVGDFNVNAAHILTLNALENNIEHPKLNLLKTIIEEQINLKPTSKIVFSR